MTDASGPANTARAGLTGETAGPSSLWTNYAPAYSTPPSGSSTTAGPVSATAGSGGGGYCGAFEANALGGTVGFYPTVNSDSACTGSSVSPTPGGFSTGTITSALSPIPDGTRFTVLTTGTAGNAQTGAGQGAPITTRASGAGGDANVDNRYTARGAFDPLVQRISVPTVATDNCLEITFQFLSEDFPEWQDSTSLSGDYNDVFLAEIGTSIWSVTGATVSSLDNNFAYFQPGPPTMDNMVTVDNLDGTYPVGLMSAGNGVGTMYNGGSEMLTARVPIAPTGTSIPLFLSIFDRIDGRLDSAVFVDNIHAFMSADPAVDCVEGIQVPPPPPEFLLEVADLHYTVIDVPVDIEALVGISDPDWADENFTCTWTAGTPGGAPLFANASSCDTSVAYPTGGIFQVVVTIQDADGPLVGADIATVSNTTLVHVLEADSDGDWTGVKDVGVTMTGFSTGAPALAPFTCAWSAVDGEISLPNQCEAKIFLSELGTYPVSLAVTHTMDLDPDPLVTALSTRTHTITVLVTIVPYPSDAPPGGSIGSPGSGSSSGIDVDYEDVDSDGDGSFDSVDNCVFPANADQKDIDGDGVGDVCDDDADNDGKRNDGFPCNTIPDEGIDTDHDGLDNACDPDDDADTIPDGAKDDPIDNCRLDSNFFQSDLDFDGFGDACDGDADGDGVPDLLDDFPADGDRWTATYVAPDGGRSRTLSTASLPTPDEKSAYDLRWLVPLGIGLALVLLVVVLLATRRNK